MYTARIMTISLALVLPLAGLRMVALADEPSTGTSSLTDSSPEIRLRLEVLRISMARLEAAKFAGAVDRQAAPFPCRDIVGWYSEEILNGNDELNGAKSLRSLIDDIKREGCCTVLVEQSIDVSSGQSIAAHIPDGHAGGSRTPAKFVLLADPNTEELAPADAKQLVPGQTNEGTTAVLRTVRADSNHAHIHLRVSYPDWTAASISGSVPEQTPGLQTKTRQSTRTVADGGILAMSGRKIRTSETHLLHPKPTKIGRFEVPIGRKQRKTVEDQIETIILVTPSLATFGEPITSE